MSDPRMIPADEARRWKRILDVAGTTGGLGYRHWLTIVALYEQVERQAAQIERVLKVADLLDQMAGDNGRLADSLSGEYAKGKHDAYAKAAEIIREDLGDNND